MLTKGVRRAWATAPGRRGGGVVVPGAAMERGAGDYRGMGGGGLGRGHQRPCWLPTGPSFLNWLFPLGAVLVFLVLPNITAIQVLQNFPGQPCHGHLKDQSLDPELLCPSLRIRECSSLPGLGGGGWECPRSWQLLGLEREVSLLLGRCMRGS